jgi:Deoxyxylulose-5-phosphate synthase
LNFGALLNEANEISKELKATLVDMRFVKPLDEELLRKLLKKAKIFISIEDGSIMGGAGSAVQEFASKENLNVRSILFGIPDKFIEHASREEMLVDAGLNVENIRSKLSKLL